MYTLLKYTLAVLYSPRRVQNGDSNVLTSYLISFQDYKNLSSFPYSEHS